MEGEEGAGSLSEGSGYDQDGIDGIDGKVLMCLVHLVSQLVILKYCNP